MSAQPGYDQHEMNWNSALMVDDVNQIRQLWSANENAPLQNINGQSRVHQAAHYGARNCLQYLVEQSPSCLNLADHHGETPLHRACYSGRLGAVEYLLDQGADLNAKTTASATPLHYAVHRKGDEVGRILEKLLEKGADPSAEDRIQTTPVQWAKLVGVSWPS